jgi:hypothetical protein
MTPCQPARKQGGNAIHQGGEAMTKVTFFEDYHCFEYHSPQDAQQRFRYYLYSPVYECIPFFCKFSTQRDLPGEAAVYSSDFMPSRVTRYSDE